MNALPSADGSVIRDEVEFVRATLSLSSTALLSYRFPNAVPFSTCKSYRLMCFGLGFSFTTASHRVLVYPATVNPGTPETRSIEQLASSSPNTCLIMSMLR